MIIVKTKPEVIPIFVTLFTHDYLLLLVKSG